MSETYRDPRAAARLAQVQAEQQADAAARAAQNADLLAAHHAELAVHRALVETVMADRRRRVSGRRADPPRRSRA